MSIASSMPSSQLPSTQADSQSQAQQTTQSQSENEEVESAPSIAQPRLASFRAALGPLTHTSLFQNDMATVADVAAAVNHRVSENDGREFSQDEITAALRTMNEANQIMFLEDSGEVYTL
jgi:DNA replication licensing factor MCM3